ncbi:MAG: hypothetical protein OEW12_05195 [Deltaproteobacteria bacterium]|nr:hypothetical protein [Deltaproteobacteria bacterium]
MKRPLHLEFHHPPSGLKNLLGSFSWPRRGSGDFPAMSAHWGTHRTDLRQLENFLTLTGAKGLDFLPMIYPQVMGFPLTMSLLHHPRFPIAIFDSLQIRNHLLQHRPIGLGEPLEFSLEVNRHRRLEKGVEFDFYTRVKASGDLAWEGVTTFYYRGKYKGKDDPSGYGAAPGAEPPGGKGEEMEWKVPDGGGLRFARLLGNYHPVHWWRMYARFFGFKAPFHHPAMVIEMAMAHLPAELSGCQRLDTWIKGPIYYGSQVRLTHAETPRGRVFALFPDGGTRPAIVGQRRGAQPGEPLWET